LRTKGKRKGPGLAFLPPNLNTPIPTSSGSGAEGKIITTFSLSARKKIPGFIYICSMYTYRRERVEVTIKE
jgi:hypothetical protein